MHRLRSAAWLVLTLAAPVSAAPPAVRLTYTGPPDLPPFTGRVFVVVSPREIGPKVFAQSWFTPAPFFARDVRAWPPRVPLDFTPDVGFPLPWHELPAGEHHIQAILDRDLGGQNALSSPGNLYSKPQRIRLEADRPVPFELLLDQVVPERPFAATARVKYFEHESRLLGAFHGRPTRLRAGVVLPASHADQPTRRYPVVYEIPGFSGDHHLAFAAAARNATDLDGVEALHVVLDPTCRRGHHVFADSANNGPVGRALTEEFIPALERAFRARATPASRLVTGHSSGGWSSLWLQTAYPDFFAGAWSTAPDPVDFRDFQRVDLYRPGVNLFADGQGRERPLARKDGKVAFTYRRFSDLEVVLGRGGQLGSFEAVFSPRGPDGEPLRLWDRRSGAVDPAVARAWQAYDIRLRLEQDWPALGPRLAGKLHVYMGEEDTFYLEGATRLLGQVLRGLGSDAVVELFPGRHHGDLLDAPMRRRIAREMAATLRKAAP